MAIHPIDLSTIYSQLDNVAKFNASQNQNVQNAAGIMHSVTVAQEAEKAKAVQETAKNESSADEIKDDSENSSSEEKEKSDKKENSQEEEHKQIEITDPKLGQHIDITL